MLKRLSEKENYSPKCPNLLGNYVQHVYRYIRGCFTVGYLGHAGGPADVPDDVLADVRGDVLVGALDDALDGDLDGPHGAALQ